MDAEISQAILYMIAKGNQEEALKAAKELISYVDDKPLKAEVSQLQVQLLEAKTSGEMDQWATDMVKFMKDQFALVYLQAFEQGQIIQAAIEAERFQQLLVDIKSGNYIEPTALGLDNTPEPQVIGTAVQKDSQS